VNEGSVTPTPLEQVTQLALREFQKALRKNLEYKWETKHGRPPAHAYIEQKVYNASSDEPWGGGHILRAWNVTPDSVEPLLTASGPPKDSKIDGMFYDLLIGFFAINDDFTRVSINWQTGPRFGRGFVHSIDHRPDGSLSLHRAQSTWKS
jgi:hypothetical protein